MCFCVISTLDCIVTGVLFAGKLFSKVDAATTDLSYALKKSTITMLNEARLNTDNRWFIIIFFFPCPVHGKKGAFFHTRLHRRLCTHDGIKRQKFFDDRQIKIIYSHKKIIWHFFFKTCTKVMKDYRHRKCCVISVCWICLACYGVSAIDIESTPKIDDTFLSRFLNYAICECFNFA